MMVCKNNFKERKFILKQASLGPASAAAIGKALRNNDKFCILDLAMNSIGDLGIE